MHQERNTFFLFVDDSGSSCPDKSQHERRDGLDAFAFGGLLVSEGDVEFIKARHKQFMISQQLECPNGSFKKHLHSTKIRCKKNDFEWLKCPERAEHFYNGLHELLSELPIYAHACVVDRPTYCERFNYVYDDKWEICRSAYQILIERAVKCARALGGTKLIVHVERTGRNEDKKIQGYHDVMRTLGMEFDVKNSSGYSPMAGDDLSLFLGKKIEFQTKESRLMQLADLVLYPVIKGGYDPEYEPYRFLMQNRLVIDNHVQDVKTMGVKYYCFPKK
jgi:hypothetical protein